jgi:hypothetical protein
MLTRMEQSVGDRTAHNGTAEDPTDELDPSSRYAEGKAGTHTQRTHTGQIHNTEPDASEVKKQDCERRTT